MGEVLNINEVIKIIPILLQYLVPGYIFISIRSFSLTKDVSRDKYIILKSLVLSFIFLRTVYPIINKVLIHFKLPEELILCIFIISIIIISILYIRFDLEEHFVKVMCKGKTTKEDGFDFILKDVILPGARAMLYLESEKLIYTGSLTYYDDKFSGDNRSIVLAGYTLHTFDGVEIYNYEGNEKNVVILKMKDIKRIEIFK